MSGPDDPKSITVIGGDGEHYARGAVDATRVVEKHPCFLCRAFEKPPLQKVIQFFMQPQFHCTMLPDGNIKAPAQKLPDGSPGQSMVIDPRNFGWCRRDAISVDLQATCMHWEQKRDRSDF
jgi:hypothetical protein